MKNKPKIIGILAGMGPKSTAPFVNLVVGECQKQYGAKNDIDFPHMIIYSLPTPFYIDRPINHKLMTRTVCLGLKKLEQTGVNFIAIPCNTIHAYFNELIKCVKIPILNIVDETLKRIPQKTKNVSLLATSQTIDSKIYQNGLDKSKFTLIYDNKIQNQVNKLIKEIKNNGKSKTVIGLWKKLVAYLVSKKIEAAIIACTDLNVVLEKNEMITFVDSSESLAKAIVKKYLG